MCITLVREGENGMVFDPENEKMIADVLEQFASMDKSERSAMASASKVIISKLDLE